MTVNGEFYIDNDNDHFYLRETNAWNKKGQLVRAHIVGLWSEDIFPFTATQVFELGLSSTDEHFYQAFSELHSSVRCIFPTASDTVIVLTDSLSGYLGSGRNVICTATFTGVSNDATLVFNDTVVRKHSPLWVVLPPTPDVAMAGLRCLFGSEPL